MNIKSLISGIEALAKGRGELGQVQVLAVFLFLLLIPTTVIIAQNATINATSPGEITGELTGETISDIPNETQNETNDGTTETVPEDNQSEATDNIEQTTNIVIEENQTTNETFPDPEQPANYTNETQTSYNVTIPDETNQTNETAANETVINQTGTNQITANETINETETNETIEIEPTPPETNQTVNETTNGTAETPTPILDVGILSPDSVTRGLSIQLKAYVKNTGFGTAKNVEIEWILPDGFVILTGSGSVNCQEVAPETSCWNNITAAASISSYIGVNDIRVRVSYVE